MDRYMKGLNKIGLEKLGQLGHWNSIVGYKGENMALSQWNVNQYQQFGYSNVNVSKENGHIDRVHLYRSNIRYS